jgi:hypothetical protein
VRSFLFVIFVIFVIAAGGLSAQSASTTYTRDINGNPVPGGATVSTDGVTTDLRQSINGREVPIEQVQEKVLSQSGNTKVTERIVRHYGANGQVVKTDRIVTEETKTGEGESIVHATTYRSDISGNMNEAERKTVETRKNGAETVTNTEIQKKDLSGSFSVAEKRAATSEQTGDGKRANETVMLRDANGNLYEAQRSSTTEKTSGNQTVTNSAIYEPTVSGEMRLTRQEVQKSVANPDGTSTQEVEIFGRPSDGRAREAGAPPALTEKRFIERQKGPGGAVLETQTVQLPDVNNPGHLDPAHKVSETICRGECTPKK